MEGIGMQLSRLVFGLAFAGLALVSMDKPAFSQNVLKTTPCTDASSASGTSSSGRCIPASYKDANGWAQDVDATHPLPVNASVSASITGFPGTGSTTGTPISVTSSNTTGTLPAGTVVTASNVGTTNAAYCKLGATATVNDQLIAPQSWFAFTVGSATQLSCITASSTTTVNMTGGAGIPTGAGGGGAGGGAVYGPTAVGSAAANPPVLMAGTANAGATGNVQVLKVDSSGNAYVTGGSPAGTTTASMLYSSVAGASSTACNARSDTNAQINPVNLDLKGNTCTRPPYSGATGSAVPSEGDYVGANSGGNLTGIVQADTSAAISVSTATTTQIVALASSKKIYVTALDVIAGGTGNLKFVYGTGSSCGTGTTDLTGNYNLTAQSGLTKGAGLGPVLVVPASNALCVTTSAAVQMSGSVAYTQF